MRDGHCLINLCRGTVRKWLLGDQGNKGLGGQFELYEDKITGCWYWAREDEDEAKPPVTSFTKPVELQNADQKKCVIAFIVTPQTSW
jgi:hypothetical protein